MEELAYQSILVYNQPINNDRKDTNLGRQVVLAKDKNSYLHQTKRMTRYVIENKIEDPEKLKGFNAEGYWFHPDLSNENKFVFIRE